MNRYDSKYDIRIANLDDITNIMMFINDYWRKGHILGVDRKFFEYEFVYREQVNFVIAVDKENNTIEGLLGFIYTSNPENTDTPDIWGSIWKVKENTMPFLGVEIAKRLEILTNCRLEIGVGVNLKTAAPLREKIFSDNIVKMNHYYKLNNEKEIYKIANIKRKFEDTHDDQYSELYSLDMYETYEQLCDKFDVEALNDAIPYKDLWYVNHRFYLHPYYKYKIFGIKNVNEELSRAFIVCKEVYSNDCKCLRIVDCYGDEESFKNIGKHLTRLILENEYEYIDLYVYGMNHENLEMSGFILKQDDTNIIPNYFEPFVQSNIDIWINYPKKIEGVKCFKADADQDRPNFTPQTKEINN